MTAQAGSVLGKSARRYALAVLVVVYTFNFIDRQILAILLPAIKAEFLVDDWVLGFLAGSAFALFYATLGLPIALLADRWNRRNLIAVALAIWSAMTVLSGVAANVMQLALARIGVGIGEAGCSPPAHSMISDYYPPEKRATAMGVFTVGISAGIMIAYLAGGWVAENIGWRAAFLIVGLPGLVLALIVRFTVVEPTRGSSEDREDSATRYGILDVSKFLYGRKSFLHMSFGAALASFNAYAILSFFPSFLIRSHGMNLQEIGMYLGVIIGISSAIGFVGGGYIADRLGAINRKYALWAIAASAMTAWLFVFPLYLLENSTWVLILFFIASVPTNVYLATTFAQTQSLVRLRMRAAASAILLFIINIIGLGLGPQFAGILSDFLAASYGAESMRYSLLSIGAVMGPWVAFHYFAAGRYIASDLDRVDTD
jgi:predicted MFS family arabinose efflux permease